MEFYGFPVKKCSLLLIDILHKILMDMCEISRLLGTSDLLGISFKNH